MDGQNLKFDQSIKERDKVKPDKQAYINGRFDR